MEALNKMYEKLARELEIAYHETTFGMSFVSSDRLHLRPGKLHELSKDLYSALNLLC